MECDPVQETRAHRNPFYSSRISFLLLTAWRGDSMIILDETAKPPIEEDDSSQSQSQLQVPNANGSAHPPRSSSPIPPPPPSHPSHTYGRGNQTPVTPPVYSSVTKPSDTVTYLFSPMPGNAMLLIPPKNVSNAKHPYLIGVGLNCFTPSSHITTVRKYGWDGEFVGDFEIGTSNSKNPSSVCLRGNEHPIYDVLVSSTRLFKNFWTWKTLEHEKASVTLYWDDSSGGGVITCFSSKDRTPGNFLARFSPRGHPRRQGRPTDFPKLEVTPDGHEVFEDILMSALIIERIRTNPAS
ncbi:para-aminobenzoate synthase, (PABA) [Marasmius tenuissimus]|nr:para-aminobenzoate synthase, (PABA) [Marasmius tenuissimus]